MRMIQIFKKLKDNFSSPILFLSIPIGALYLLMFIKFIALFGGNGYSDKPQDWYDFVGMITGITSLIVTVLIAWQIQKINNKSTSKYAKLPYAVKSYEKFYTSTVSYIEKRDKIVGYSFDLINYTNVYLSELAKLNYFECIYFDKEIRKDLDDYRKSLLKYVTWLENQQAKTAKEIDFVSEHSQKAQELYSIFDDIQKKMQAYISD